VVPAQRRSADGLPAEGEAPAPGVRLDVAGVFSGVFVAEWDLFLPLLLLLPVWGVGRLEGVRACWGCFLGALLGVFLTGDSGLRMDSEELVEAVRSMMTGVCCFAW